jgi:hypothetical protein
VKITSEMVEAGIAAVRPIEYDLWEGRTLDELARLVTAVYRAMRASSEDGCVKRV